MFLGKKRFLNCDRLYLIYCFLLANTNLHKKLTRTSSVNQPCNAVSVSDWLNKHHEEMSRHSSQQTSPVQSSEPHAPLSPQSSVTSSGSDSPHETDIYSRNTFLEEASGMRGECFFQGVNLDWSS